MNRNLFGSDKIRLLFLELSHEMSIEIRAPYCFANRSPCCPLDGVLALSGAACLPHREEENISAMSYPPKKTSNELKVIVILR